LKHEQFELGLERIRIDAKSWMAGKVLREARIRDTTGALVVGIQRGEKSLLFNPQGAETFQAGDEVLVMGPTHALQAFMAQAKGEAVP
jgi:K+/H+ antiporter YhaU regulatory subunit KhtT